MKIDELESRLANAVHRKPVAKQQLKYRLVKKSLVKPKIEEYHGIANLVKIPDGWEREFITNLSNHQYRIAKFLFTKIIPFETSIHSAIEDTLDSVRMATGADNPEFSLGKVQRTIQQMIELRTVRFLAHELSLTDAELAIVLNDLYETTELSVMRRVEKLLGQVKGSNAQLPTIPASITNRQYRSLESRAARNTKSQGQRPNPGVASRRA